MTYILTGLAAFPFFLLYDINAAIIRSRLLGGSFFIGCILLFGSTAGIVSISLDYIKINAFTVVCIMFAFVFLTLLVYTLFVVLSFKDTYFPDMEHNTNKKEVCSCGFYALCRHPGVLWLTGAYIFLTLAVPSPLLIKASIAFCVCNILYVIFQDLWTFPRTFTDYGRYKETVPFLIPTPQSIRRCTDTLNSRRK